MQDKKSLNAIFSSRLSLAMKKASLTQLKLANKMGVSQNAAWKWLHGSMPDTATVMRIARACNISIGYLIGSADDPSPDSTEAGLSIRNSALEKGGEKSNEEVDVNILRVERPDGKHSPPPSEPSQCLDVATLRNELAPVLERLSAMETDVKLIKKLLAKMEE